MPNTMTLIASSTVGSGGSSAFDFTSIPSTYTDLLIKVSGRINVAAVDAHIYLTFNNDSSNSYSMRLVRGNGSAASSYSETSETSMNFYATINGNSTTSNTFSNTEIYIPNYAGSAAKSVSLDAVQENNATTAWANLFAGRWSGTSAITSVKLTGSASYMQYSTAYLYGIKNS
jgi:hypothetical protein